MGNLKHLWRGKFVFPNQSFALYAAAYSAQQAKVVMARQIAKKQEVLPWVVLSYLKENPTCYIIKKEIEWTEE